MKPAFLSLCLLAAPAFGQYSARTEGDVVRLEDAKTQTVVWVMPSHGNSAFNMTVKGKKALQFPYASAEEYKRGRGMSGVPFMSPWANRLDEAAFFANGKKYPFNLELGNVRPGADNHPSHGFLLNATQWEVAEAKADGAAAWVTSRLDFYKYPQWMAQWPFAHTIEMTYRLADGVLEVRTTLHNLSVEPMPVSIGFHPYFQVNDAPRDEWTFGLGARTYWVCDRNMPTGVTKPIEQFLPKPQGSALKDMKLDDLFTDLIRDASGRATMWVQGKSEKIEVLFGRKYQAAVVWFPAGRNQDFICFEPMTGITNALNLAQKGVYKDLQSVAPGGSWSESFWIKPSGF